MKKKIAMIPARSGSKRVPKKNIRLINEKPLIDYYDYQKHFLQLMN